MCGSNDCPFKIVFALFSHSDPFSKNILKILFSRMFGETNNYHYEAVDIYHDLAPSHCLSIYNTWFSSLHPPLWTRFRGSFTNAQILSENLSPDLSPRMLLSQINNKKLVYVYEQFKQLNNAIKLLDKLWNSRIKVCCNRTLIISSSQLCQKDLANFKSFSIKFYDGLLLAAKTWTCN